jgi:O-antigen/teichoic acid export membrane protein
MERLARMENTGYAWACVYIVLVLVAGILWPLQRIALFANGVRLGAVVAIALLLPGPALFLLTSVLSAAVMAWLGLRLTGQYLHDVPTDVRCEMKAIWRRTLPQIPSTVFYCFFGQVSVLIIALLGQDAQVAEVGALGRLSLLFAVATSTMATVVIPRFSRISAPQLLRARYWQTITAQLSLSALLFLFAALFPNILLLILGSSYVGLEYAVKWSVLSALIHSLSATIWQLNVAKGWVQRAWITIPLIVAAQAIVGSVVKLSTVEGAILFGALPMLPALLFVLAIGVTNIKRELRSAESAQ